jgi:glycerol-3-phosphate acyltransferase PlsX
MNPDRYGGAPLLGVRGNVLKAHGSSNRHALHSTILAAAKIIRQDLYQRTIADVAQANALLAAPAPEIPASPAP